MPPAYLPVCLPAVKCVFLALDKMRTDEEIMEGGGGVLMRMPPGRYSHICGGGAGGSGLRAHRRR